MACVQQASNTSIFGMCDPCNATNESNLLLGIGLSTP